MKVGVIGGGNLGSSLIRGFLKSGVLNPDEIIVSDPDERKIKELAKLSITVTSDNRRLVRECEVVFIAVKPDLVETVLKEVEDLSEGKLFISVAAGVSTKFIEERTKARVIRAMPNICGSVLQMASAYSNGSRATARDENIVKQLLGKLGTTFHVEEKLMGAVTGLSGSGPAFFFYLIKAVQDAGIELGLPRDVSFKLAVQTARGASEILLTSEEKIDELISRVCTPRGTTIEGMKILEEKRVADAIREAVKAAAKRAEELSR
ncbi:MAG: pyrroline-5-carboxylate reductase [Candidatus Hadarchaeum sp.]|uniref:pyrroline-5-carboxylate reductase n=1 Tax=Candidatus Hadarchaeum sp. TaxID=2883567 RepID=UPI00316E1D38